MTDMPSNGVFRRAAADLPTAFGDFRVLGYRSEPDGGEHLAVVKGDVAGRRDVLTRVHSECLTGDVFASQRCDCGTQLQEALRLIADESRGVVVYNRNHEGRGIGLVAKLSAYGLQDQGLDTVEANVSLGHPPDARDYKVAAHILRDLGIESVRLLTNNPDKIAQLERLGVSVAERVPHEVGLTTHNDDYLAAKAAKLGHLIGDNGSEDGS